MEQTRNVLYVEKGYVNYSNVYSKLNSYITKSIKLRKFF